VAVAGTSATFAQEGPGGIVHRWQLDNGLDVVVIENHAAPLATVLFAVRGGADLQAQGEEGLAHLMEHLTFRSYGRRPGAFDVAVGELSGIKQGLTSIEVVSYFLVLPSDRTEKGIGLLGDLVREIDFGNDDIEEEQVVVLDELERRQTDPEVTLKRHVDRVLWGAAWHRRDVGGDSLSLAEMSGGRIADAYGRYYVPNNSALIVTGDVEPAAVHDAAVRHFGEWSRGRDVAGIRQLAPIEPLDRSRVLTVVGYVPDVTIRVAFRGPSYRTDPAATIAASVLLGLINETDSALQERLVATGLFHSLQGSTYPTGCVGQIEIVGKTSVELAPGAVETLLYELDRMDELTGVTQGHIRIAKRRREVEAAIAAEAASVLAPELAALWAGAGLDYYLTSFERANALGAEELKQFAREYISMQPIVIGVLGPDDAIAAVRSMFEGGS
jgi:zinc protease